jgi:hypothetical protein
MKTETIELIKHCEEIIKTKFKYYPFKKKLKYFSNDMLKQFIELNEGLK